MNIVQIPLTKLLGHPGNANVMSEDNMAKLRSHIERHGHYEPLVVRTHPSATGYFEMLNGHHRKMVLEHLGHEQANCVVWKVSDEEALMLLATLNRLSGQDDPYKRSALLTELSQRYESKELLKQLPETREQLHKLLAIARQPEPLPPDALGEIPQAMMFFVRRDQKKLIEQALRLMAVRIAGDVGDGKLSRGDLLAVLADRVLADSVSIEQEEEDRKVSTNDVE